MKKSSQKLLFYLGKLNQEDKNRELSYSCLPYILPELSEAGIRSLVYLMDKNFWLEMFGYHRSRGLRITASGNRQLQAVFPAVFVSSLTRSVEWHCMVFISPPKSDRAFRNLRRLIINDGAQALSRGVYLKPGAFSLELMGACDEFYRQSVSIFTINQWLFGFDSQNQLRKIGLSNNTDILSGISKEIKQLLSNIDDDNKLHYQQKKQISSILDRFYELALVNGKLDSALFSQELSIRSVYLECQELLKLLQ